MHLECSDMLGYGPLTHQQSTKTLDLTHTHTHTHTGNNDDVCFRDFCFLHTRVADSSWCQIVHTLDRSFVKESQKKFLHLAPLKRQKVARDENIKSVWSNEETVTFLKLKPYFLLCFAPFEV